MPPLTPEQEKQARRKALSGRICGCIMLLATAVFLAWSLPMQFLGSPVRGGLHRHGRGLSRNIFPLNFSLWVWYNRICC